MFKKTVSLVAVVFIGYLYAVHGSFTTYNSSDMPPAALAIQEKTIWIGYDDALVKYSLADSSSRRFTTKDGLINDTVHAIAIDRAGRKWIGTNSGISIFDDKSWIQHTPGDGIGRNPVYALMVGKDNEVWAGTEKGLFVYNGSTWSFNEVSHSVTSLALDSLKNMWIGTKGDGVFQLNGKVWKQHRAEWGLDTVWNSAGTFKLVPGFVETSLMSDTVFNILTDQDGTVWCATKSGISLYQDGYWRRLKNVGRVPFYGLFMDKTGAKWIGGSATLLRVREKTVTNFYPGKGLYRVPGYPLPIKAISCDSNGDVWVGTGSVLSKFDGQTWSRYTATDGLWNSVTSVVIKDSSIWFGTTNGVVSFNGKKWQRYSESDGLPSGSVSDIAIDSKGNKWLACWGGVAKLDDKQCVIIDSLNQQKMLAGYSIAVDSTDRIWCSTFLFTIGAFDGKGWTIYQNPLWTTERASMRDITVSPAGKVWAVYAGGGLFSLQGAEWTRVEITRLSVANYASDLCVEPTGKLWVAHNMGVSSLENNTWEHYTCLPDKFPDGEVIHKIGTGCNYIGYEAVLKDAEGRLWLGSARTGLTMFDGAVWKRFDSTNGLPSSGVFSLAEDNAKNIWVGTMGGAVKIDPGSLTISRKQRTATPDRPEITIMPGIPGIKIVLSDRTDKSAMLELFSLDGRLRFSQQAVFIGGVYVLPRAVHGPYIARVSTEKGTISRLIMASLR